MIPEVPMSRIPWLTTASNRSGRIHEVSKPTWHWDPKLTWAWIESKVSMPRDLSFFLIPVA